MGSGYFGKLPARADFVIGRCPAGFLKIWEPFLVKGISQSRIDLKDAWEEAYMTMPVWRFRLSPLEAGEGLSAAVAGAMMPNVDRVGRKFPLTLVAAILPDQPGADSVDAWFDRAETLLRGTLSEDADFENFQRTVDRLDGPAAREAPEACEPADGMTDFVGLAGDGVAVQAWFWCGAGDRRFAFSSKGLPEPGAFRWLILPEAYGSEDLIDDAAGTSHGRSHPEVHRT
jgi:type VI secretion system ImpM family protein